MTTSTTWTRRERPIDHGRFRSWQRIDFPWGWEGKVDRGPYTRYQVHDATLDKHLREELTDDRLANDLGECFYENWPGIESFRAHHAGAANASTATPWPSVFEPLSHMRPDITVDWRPSTESDAVPGATYNPREVSISFAGRMYNCAPPDEHGVITFTVPAEDREVVQALQGKSVSVDRGWLDESQAHNIPPMTPEMKELLMQRKDRPVLLENEPLWSRDLSEKLQHEPVREYQPMSVGYARDIGVGVPAQTMRGHRGSCVVDDMLPREPSLRERYCTGPCAMLNAEPHLHDHGCPVAPVPGLHGGMRLEPVLTGNIERWSKSLSNHWLGQRRTVVCEWPSWVDEIAISPVNLSAAPYVQDIVLAAFYLPPGQPDDAPTSLPVDSDPEMETVAARATHEPERWKPVMR